MTSHSRFTSKASRWSATNGRSAAIRLPSEILGRLTQDRLLGLDLRLLRPQLGVLGLEPGDLLRLALRPAQRLVRAADRGSRRTRTQRLDPVRQGASGDSEIIGDAPQRGTGGGLVQINGLPTELVGVALPGHERIFSLPPARLLDSSVSKTQGQGPFVMK